MYNVRRRFTTIIAAVLVAGGLPALAMSTAGAAPGEPDYARATTYRPAAGTGAPEEFNAVEIDLAQVRRSLRGAPGPGSRGQALAFEVPAPEGGTERFEVRQTQVMQPALAARHPEIATYYGRSLDVPGTTIAVDVTPMGFHASVRRPQGERDWYVDPATKRRGTTTHLSYYGGDLPRAESTFVERETPNTRPQPGAAAETAAKEGDPGAPVVKRTYRLALLNDPAYADYFGTDNVLAEKVTLVNRVNQIYQDDLAIWMVLVNETDKLNLDTEAEATGANGPCGSNPCFEPADPSIPGSYGQLDFCDVPTLGRARTVLGQLVGAGGYDVGHVALGVDGGGIAYRGVVGWDYKGGGCTGLGTPQGDFFAIDFVSHELGHQFSANHTFNGVRGACQGGNRSGGSAVEPGSGSSVMAYAGICGADDLQPHTDPYFSQRTLDEINGYVRRDASTVIEVQTVSLYGFDTAGDSFRLTFDGRTSDPITRGATYNRVAVEQVVEDLTGQDVTIAQWGYDPYGSFVAYPAPLTPLDGAGFQVIFSGSLLPEAPGAHEDQPLLGLTGATGGVSGFVGETARGGAEKNGGDEAVETINHNPEVTAPANRTIPIRTPFALRGQGSDADGDDLVYLWEQNDEGSGGGTALTSNAKRNGPLFRVFGTAADVSEEGTLKSPSPGLNQAGTRPFRQFPDLGQVLANNTNARTGQCPSAGGGSPSDKVRNCYSEFLPTDDYTGGGGKLRFRLTARDTSPYGGGTAHDDVVLNLDRSAGPFLVKSLNSFQAVPRGTWRKIQWDVAGTRKYAGNVRIRLSTVNGYRWNYTLKQKTPNDGVAWVKIPKHRTKYARIIIEAKGNYFFDANDAKFQIRR